MAALIRRQSEYQKVVFSKYSPLSGAIYFMDFKTHKKDEFRPQKAN